jgi:hypothetical protein
VINSENTSLSVTVNNSGDVNNQFNVTLYVNNSVAQTWTTSMLKSSQTEAFSWSKTLGVGVYNLTVIASGGGAPRVDESGSLTVVKPPSLAVEYSPKPPAAGQRVVFNGSGSIDTNPGGKITSYSWKIFAPSVPISGTANGTGSGPVINYTFGTSGNWTVVLTVTDNYGVTYNLKRSATFAYQEVVIVPVASSGMHLSELLIGIIVVVVVIIIAASVILLRRRRRPKPRT